jgi:penicillin amidase
MRGRLCIPALLALLQGEAEATLAQALEHLRRWDFEVRADSVAAAIFNVFFPHWCKTVTAVRFPPEWAGFVAANAGGIAVRLLQGDPHGWFERKPRVEAARDALRATLDELTSRLGQDMSQWIWGRLHVLLQKHFLSGRGELGQLLDRSGTPLQGDGTTVFSNTPDPSHAVWLGAGYRMIVDFAEPEPGLWHIEVGSVSGHPGSPHYDDQLRLWHEGGYRYVSLHGDGKQVSSLSLVT